MRNLPPALEAAVARVRHVMPDQNGARAMIACFDLTHVNRNTNPMIINHLARDTDQGQWGRVAALCVEQSFLTQAFNSVARRRVNIGSFVNFPDGDGTPDQTARDVRRAIIKGANEIEIVMNHEEFRKGNKAAVRAVLESARQACGKDATLKVVLETSAYSDAGALYDAATLAIDCGADMLVTASGPTRMRPVTTSLEAAALMLHAIRDSGKPVGLKIAGDGDDIRSAAPYLALARQMMGSAWAKPANFRIGGQNLHKDAAAFLSNGGRAVSRGI
jgi:deoxyribose-phosphate aldolase